MLRRAFVIFVGCVLIGLSACGTASGGSSSSNPVVSDFSCEADIRYQDMNLKGTLSRTTAGTLAMTFSEPETLKGITAEWNGETVSASLYGLSFDLSPDTLPTGALGKVLTDALDAALRAPGDGTLTEDGLRWEGTGQNGTITILSDPDDGSLLSMEVPSIPLTASFSDFTKSEATS